MTESWTSLKLIQWTAGYFEKKGIPNPRLDAELLLAHLLRCQRIDLYTNHEKKVSEKDLARFKELIERRAAREPLQYLIGEAEFWGLKFKVTPDVLIPRPETELLIEEAMKAAGERLIGSFRSAASRKPSDDKRRENADNGRAAIERGRLSVPGSLSPAARILEIGTGSGCIAIALAKNLSSAHIVATDISKEALAVARGNAEGHRVTDRIEFILSDIAPWRTFQAEGCLFDLIASNPPYIASDEFSNLQPEVRDFEPRRALNGGPDGLDLIRRILEEAPPFLRPGGTLLLEIGEGHGESVRSLIQGGQGPLFKEIRKDLSGKDRILVCKK